MGLLLGLRLSLEIKQSSKCLPSNLQLFHNINHRQMSQTEPISILFLTFPEVAQAMWWVAQAMWSGLRRLCGGLRRLCGLGCAGYVVDFCENNAKLSPT